MEKIEKSIIFLIQLVPGKGVNPDQEVNLGKKLTYDLICSQSNAPTISSEWGSR